MKKEVRGELSIINKTSVAIPRLFFDELRDEILGEDYSLSIAYVTPKESQTINNNYRGKDHPTNVLSFPLNKKSGEILICPSVLKKEIADKKFDKNFPELVVFLVIHGMLHLKGMTHSSRIERARMEKKEAFYSNKYDQKHFSGNRRGNRGDESRRRRISKRRKES